MACTVCPKKTQAHSLLVLKARQLSELAQLRYSISNIDQCNSQFYYDLYKALTGLKIHWSSGFTEDLRCQVIVDSFEEYLSPHIKLGHIQGYNLARSDPVTVGNMLDVLIALLKTYPDKDESLSDESLSEDEEPDSQYCPAADSQATPHTDPHTIPYLETMSPPDSQCCSELSSLEPLQESELEDSTKEEVLESLLRSYLRDRARLVGQDESCLAPVRPPIRPNTAHEGYSSSKKATNILQQTERHFPYVYVESPTLNKLRSQQIRHFANFSKSQADHMLPSVRKNIDEMYQKQSVMLKMLQKDLVHAKKVQECHDRKHWEQQTRTAVHAKRQAAARAWRYFQDYELQMRAKLQKARTREEQTLVQTFQNGLKQHKEVVIADRRALKEKQLLLKNRVQKELESMEKRYHDVFDSLAGTVKQEEQKLLCSKQSHHQKMSLIRKKLQTVENEIREIQDGLERDDDVQHFRELDASRVKWKF